MGRHGLRNGGDVLNIFHARPMAVAVVVLSLGHSRGRARRDGIIPVVHRPVGGARPCPVKRSPGVLLYILVRNLELGVILVRILAVLVRVGKRKVVRGRRWPSVENIIFVTHRHSSLK